MRGVDDTGELTVPRLRDGVAIVGFDLHGDLAIPSLVDGRVTMREVVSPRTHVADSLQSVFDGLALGVTVAASRSV